MLSRGSTVPVWNGRGEILPSPTKVSESGLSQLEADSHPLPQRGFSDSSLQWPQKVLGSSLTENTSKAKPNESAFSKASTPKALSSRELTFNST